MAKKINWGAAAETMGISDRTLRRWHQRWDRDGYDGLMDRRKGKPNSHRVAVKTVEEVLRLYREKYYDLNMRHFHEKLSQEHQIHLSYRVGAESIAPEAMGRSTFRGFVNR